MAFSPIRDEVEHLKFSLTESSGVNISGNTVQVAVAARGTLVGSFTWLACTFISNVVNADGTATSRWRTTTPPTWSLANYPLSAYHVWAKVTDSPETPWCDLGTLNITPH